MSYTLRYTFNSDLSVTTRTKLRHKISDREYDNLMATDQMKYSQDYEPQGEASRFYEPSDNTTPVEDSYESSSDDFGGFDGGSSGGGGASDDWDSD